MNQVMKAAIGTALSIAFVGVAYIVASKYIMNTIGDVTQDMVERHQQQVAAQQAKLAQDQSRQHKVERRTEAEMALKQAIAKRKEAAWLKWYTEPEGCQSFKSDQHMVECINHKMRSQRVFDELLAQGKIEY